MAGFPKQSAQRLRREIHARAAAYAPQEAGAPEEVSCIVHAVDGYGGHGNFLTASYQRICARPEWAARLGKAYTSRARMPRQHDRRWSELECAASSDALLMNIFCYPRLLHREAICRLLGVSPGNVPEFGVRSPLPMRNNEVDRTEFDMRIGDVLVEAKLTEGGFGTASAQRLGRYCDAENLFDLQALPRQGQKYAGYQILRGLLAAERCNGRYLVIFDERRPDLIELCFRVTAAARSSDLRHRLRLLTWQDLLPALPSQLRSFLQQRFGICRAE